MSRTRSLARLRAMRAHGYTLIEVLVVIAIMAIVAGAAILAVGTAGGGRVAEREAQRLAELTRLMCERAQFTGHDYGLTLAPASYRFSRSGYRRWEPETKDELRPRTLPDGLLLSASREEHALELSADLPEEPQLVCYASGELTPFSLRIAASAEATAQVTGEIDGSVHAQYAPQGAQ